MRIAKLEPYGLLQAAGDDARAFLHAQLTNDVASLAPNQARQAGWCTAKGRLLASFLVVPCEGGFLLQLSRDLLPAVASRLSMFILRSKVKLSDASANWAQFGLWGPGAEEALAASGITAPAGDFECAAAAGTVAIRLAPGRFLLLAAAARSASWQANASAEDWALAEIRAGRMLITQATQDQFVPQMVNLELAGGVDFRKGCYPGQEIVARAQYRGAVKRRMVRLRGPALRAAQALFSDDAPGQASGMVVNAAGGEALAVLPLEVIEGRIPVRAQPAGAALEILPLPYAL
jgi:folate-binding protein YgfZ